ANADGERVPEGSVERTVLANAEPVELVPTVLTIEQLADEATFQRYISTLVQFDDIQFINSDAGVTYADVVNNESINRTLRDCFGNELVSRMSSFADFAGERTPEGNGSLVGVLSVFVDTRQITLRTPADFNFNNERCGISVGGDLISIRELRDQFSGATTSVSPDTKIRGVVISDRTTENINFQNLFLQDGDAGIVVRFTSGHDFNLGEELEITVSDLELSEFNGLLQVNNVPVENAVSQGSGTLPEPRLVDLSDVLGDPETYESTLIRVEGATLSGGTTLGGNLDVNDGTGTIPMFTFNSATFANTPTPNGEIDLVAIVSDFGEVQLVIRDATDLEGGSTGGDPEQITLSEIRDLFEGGASSVPSNRFIRATVISDLNEENTDVRNLIVQDASGGIVVRFQDPHNFTLNEDVRIDVSGEELSEFNDLLQVNFVPNANAVTFGPTTPPTPRVATVQEILNMDNGEEWESTLVQINMASLSGGGGVFAGGETISVTDNGSGTLGMFTRSQASFAGSALPAGEVTLTCVVTQFQENRQVLIRNLSDIEE
ncbi:MAG: DUF5689 domain-containing protein, partial [Bacteroidota bacterium]